MCPQESFQLKLSTVTKDMFQQQGAIHAISLIIFWASKIILRCYYSICRNSGVLFFGQLFYESRYCSVELRYCVFGPVTSNVKMLFHAFVSSCIFKSGCILVSIRNGLHLSCFQLAIQNSVWTITDQVLYDSKTSDMNCLCELLFLHHFCLSCQYH